jgi:metallophosphoesterase superfamily enzyme
MHEHPAVRIQADRGSGYTMPKKARPVMDARRARRRGDKKQTRRVVFFRFFS